ncbi:unnamed protein product [Closterium sp. NIES-53]
MAEFSDTHFLFKKKPIARPAFRVDADGWYSRISPKPPQPPTPPAPPIPPAPPAPPVPPSPVYLVPPVVTGNQPVLTLLLLSTFDEYLAEADCDKPPDEYVEAPAPVPRWGQPDVCTWDESAVGADDEAADAEEEWHAAHDNGGKGGTEGGTEAGTAEDVFPEGAPGGDYDDGVEYWSRLLLVSPPVAPDPSGAPPPGSPLPATPSWHALPSPCLWSSQVSASPTALACPALPSLRRGSAARRSSLLLVSFDDCYPADSPHRRSVSSSASGSARTFLSCVCTLTEVVSSPPTSCGTFVVGRAFSSRSRFRPHRIGLVMEVARTSTIHAAAPHFLWSFAVRYAGNQLNLWPRVSLLETSPTLCWTGEVGDASVFRVWGSRAFVRDTSADKLSARAIPCVFLGFVPNAPGWRFYHPTSCRVFPSQDVTFDESVPFYHLFPYRSSRPPPLPLFLAPGPPPVDPLLPQGPAPSGVSQVDPLPGTAPFEVAIGSGAARGVVSEVAVSGSAEPEVAESKGAGSGGAEPGGAEPGDTEPTGVEPGGAEPEGVEPGGAESEGAEFGGPSGASPRLSPC